MRISYTNFTIASDIVAYDYFWLSVKTYIEDNYQGNEKFSWSFPIIETNATSIDELADQVLDQDPDILMMSLYVWNHAISNDLAKIVKSKKPNITIIAGGPQVEPNKLEFWLENKHIDFICDPDGYGEVFLNQFLYELENDKNWRNVPYLRSKTIRSNVTFNKRSFEWPKNIFGRNEDYIKSRKDLALKINSKFYVVYETSRGCPYGCMYCEWGGGINSKVAFKPTEYIIEDLNFLMDNYPPDIVGFTDANFGINDRDVQLVEYLCSLKVKTGFPKRTFLFGPTKTKKENLYRIEELLAEHDLVNEHKVSIQDLNPLVNINIKRTDAPWADQMDAYKKIRDKYGCTIRLELILGLPGATLDSYYDALDIMGQDSVFSKRYWWILLPTTPASTPEYIEKHKIKTIKSRYGVRASNGVGSILRIGQTENIDGYTNSLLLDDKYTKPSDIVVETSSYTREEWLEMYMMDQLIAVLEIEHYTNSITKYLNDEHGISYSMFYRKLWEKVIVNADFPDVQGQMLREYLDEARAKLNETSNLAIDTYENSMFNVYGVFEPMFNIMIHINRYTFYKRISDFIIDEFGDIPGIHDLCMWSCNMIKFVDYIPGGTTFESEYNWVEYFKTKTLSKGRFINRPLDTTFGRSNDEIRWHTLPMEDKLKEYFLKICSDQTSKVFANVEIQHV